MCEPVDRDVGKPWKDRSQIPRKKPRIRSSWSPTGQRSCRNDFVVRNYVCPSSGLLRETHHCSEWLPPASIVSG